MNAVADQLRPQLLAGLQQAKLEVSQPQAESLLGYLQLLHKWNRAYNLSGIKDIGEMLSLHVLDSLLLLPMIDGRLVADVGTGAGLPGIPLAICLPEVRFILIDSNSKKTRFIFQTCAQLGLRNVDVVHSRVQDYASAAQVDIVTSRAFASLADMVSACSHLLAPAGKFLAMKGQEPVREIAELPANCAVTEVRRLQLPGSDAERHVIDIRLVGARHGVPDVGNNN